jgi:hypothetical protein
VIVKFCAGTNLRLCQRSLVRRGTLFHMNIAMVPKLSVIPITIFMAGLVALRRYVRKKMTRSIR